MGKTGAILRHEFIRTVRRKGFLIVTLAFPLLALAGMLAYQLLQGSGVGQEPVREIGYVDGSGIFAEFQVQPDFTFVAFSDQESARTALLDREIAEYYLIPPDYLQSGLIMRFITHREMEPGLKLGEQLEDFLVSNLVAGRLSGALATRVKAPSAIVSWRLGPSGEVTPGALDFGRLVMPFIFGLLLTTSIFGTSSYLLQSITEEKENRVMEVLLSSVSTRQLLTGKVVGLGAVGLLQIGIWLGSAWLAAGFFASRSLLAAGLAVPLSLAALMVVYFLLGYLFFAVLMAGLGAVVSTTQEGSQIASLFSMTAVAPIAVFQSILTNPDHVAFRAMSIFPFTAPVTMIFRLGAGDIHGWELGASLAVLVASVAAGVPLVAKLFRLYLLMYGKRPGLRELWRNLVRA